MESTVEEVNKKVAESIVNVLDKFDKTEDLNSKEASIIIQQAADMYKTFATYDTEMKRLALDQQIADDKKIADDAANKVEKMNFWATVADIVVKTALGTSSSMFNAAIFQHLLNAEKDTTIGSTSMKTCLRGGFKIFKNNT